MKTLPVLLNVITLSIALALMPKTLGQAAGALKYRERHIKQHLTRLDSMDFFVFTHRRWDKLRNSHASDIVVHWPDGRRTQGLAKHIEGLRAMLAYAPDARIQMQPIMFESDDWTCVIGDMQGTFSKPMPLPHGKKISPTRKPFKIKVCAVSHWNKKGIMDEEYLFWDNQSLMQQMGVTK